MEYIGEITNLFAIHVRMVPDTEQCNVIVISMKLISIRVSIDIIDSVNKPDIIYIYIYLYIIHCVYLYFPDIKRKTLLVHWNVK